MQKKEEEEATIIRKIFLNTRLCQILINHNLHSSIPKQVDRMLNPTFSFKLGQQIQSGLAVTGKFDGKSPSLACGTIGGKILLHSPHEANLGVDQGTVNALKYLNLNRKITAMAAGSLVPNKSHSTQDMLFVGTQSNLLAYDVERNADNFFVDVQDGVNALLLGRTTHSPTPLLIAGGNCSILGFDAKGSESFWTVTGDNVSSISMCDIDGNGQPALLVGSDDFEIRVFRNEEMNYEISEADRVTFLKNLRGSKFAYGLANGTVGVYTGAKDRVWRVKTKNKVTALHSYDLDLDGVDEVFSGWSNGAFNVRKEDSGEVIFKQTMDSSVAAILTADYRMDGKPVVMMCSENGEVRAFQSTDVEFGAVLESGVGKEKDSADQRALNELQAQKAELLKEMQLLEKSTKNAKSGEVPVGSLPLNTDLTYTVEADSNTGSVCLKVEVNTDVQIVNLIAVDLEGVILVDREVLAISPKDQSKTAILPLKPTKNVPCTIRVQTHIATRSLGSQLHVYEKDIKLPRFAAFRQITDSTQFHAPKSKVVFNTLENIERFVQWLQFSFILHTPIKVGEGKFNAHFRSVCKTVDNNKSNADLSTGGGRNYAMESNENGKSEGEVLLFSMFKKTEQGRVQYELRIHCESMELAADLVQDIGKFFKITELDSEAEFEQELSAFEEVLARVEACSAARTTLAADMADDSQRIKAYVIRAEDARLMPDMHAMRKAYTELSALNNQMVMGYNVRAANHENLLAALKDVNLMIQKAANLRIGKAKQKVVNDCRAAVKANNMTSLFRIIRQGYDPNGVGNSAAAISQKG